MTPTTVAVLLNHHEMCKLPDTNQWVTLACLDERAGTWLSGDDCRGMDRAPRFSWPLRDGLRGEHDWKRDSPDDAWNLVIARWLDRGNAGHLPIAVTQGGSIHWFKLVARELPVGKIVEPRDPPPPSAAERAKLRTAFAAHFDALTPGDVVAGSVQLNEPTLGDTTIAIVGRLDLDGDGQQDTLYSIVGLINGTLAAHKSALFVRRARRARAPRRPSRIAHLVARDPALHRAAAARARR